MRKEAHGESDSTCDGPRTFGAAVYWILSRLLGGDPDGLSANSPLARVTALLVTFYGLLVLIRILDTILAERVAADIEPCRQIMRNSMTATHPRA